MGRILEFKTYQEFLEVDKKTSWQYLIYRNQSPLINSLMLRGISLKEHYKKLLGIDYSWKCVRSIDFYMWHNPEDVADIQRIAAEFDFAKIKKLIKQCYALGEEILAFSKKIREKDWSASSENDLLETLKEYERRLKEFAVYIIYPLYAHEEPYGKKLREYLKKKGRRDIDNAVGILTYPKKKNFSSREQYDFLSLVLAIKKTSQISKLFKEKEARVIARELKKYPEILERIAKHIYNYGWLQCRNYYGEPWNLEEMAERIKAALPAAEKDFEQLKEAEKKAAWDYQKLTADLEAGDNLLKLAELSKEFVYCRTYRTDIFHKSGFDIRNLLKEIGKRHGYSFSDIIHMRIEEILALPGDKVPHKDLEERKRGFAMVMIDGKMNWFWGKDLEVFERELREFKKAQKESKAIKGIIANKGFARGRVKIVNTVDDLAKVKKGDILAAPMTFPSFVPAMERAAAFVTDEGGILCHAAIVSREMGKPCLIGTGNATRILRDGDLVEVDAVEGIVKVLEKKSSNK